VLCSSEIDVTFKITIEFIIVKYIGERKKAGERKHIRTTLY
jgi:hypothetical protein